MSGEVMLVVLFGAALHASWNVLVKSGHDKFMDTVLVATGAAVLAAVVVPFLPLPLMASWPYAAASVPLQTVYFALVAAAYRAGDMSLAYPLMRGVAPLIVAVLGGIALGERPSLGAWAGMLLICGGVLGLALAACRPQESNRAPMSFALGCAVVIAGYTLVDGIGVRLSGNAVAYTLWVFLFTAMPLLACAAGRRPQRLRTQLATRWPMGLIGGACMLGSYGLALWAMTKAPIARVAALRETSILFGMALAALIFKERLGWKGYVAAVMIVMGAMMLRLV